MGINIDLYLNAVRLEFLSIMLLISNLNLSSDLLEGFVLPGYLPINWRAYVVRLRRKLHHLILFIFFYINLGDRHASGSTRTQSSPVILAVVRILSSVF